MKIEHDVDKNVLQHPTVMVRFISYFWKKKVKPLSPIKSWCKVKRNSNVKNDTAPPVCSKIISIKRENENTMNSITRNNKDVSDIHKKEFSSRLKMDDCSLTSHYCDVITQDNLQLSTVLPNKSQIYRKHYSIPNRTSNAITDIKATRTPKSNTSAYSPRTLLNQSIYTEDEKNRIIQMFTHLSEEDAHSIAYVLTSKNEQIRVLSAENYDLKKNMNLIKSLESDKINLLMKVEQCEEIKRRLEVELKVLKEQLHTSKFQTPNSRSTSTR